MNKLSDSIKKALLNRNAVTILAVLAGVIVLWIIYNATLTKAISPQRVPVAAHDITAGSAITNEDITYVEINNDFLKKASIITSSSRLIGYYVNNGTSIPAGAMFYTSQVVAKDGLVERDLELTEEGNTIYWLKVDNTSTYANSIYPGDKIDLWLKAQTAETSNMIVYEEFITSIDVLSVKDSSGQNVFDVSSGRTPNWLAFSVPIEMYTTLKNIEFIGGMQLFPVPRNKNYTTEGAETEYANMQLKSLIENYTLKLNS